VFLNPKRLFSWVEARATGLPSWLLDYEARFEMEFCAVESCGKCTPCRIGSVRGVEVIDRIIANQDRAANRALLEELCGTMIDGSLRAMGGLMPYPVRSALRHFAEDFER
jgi:formate dehydrogenase iron-sulfur subunit